MTRRIIVTGGEGYIGSALLPEIVRRFDFPVISLDSLLNDPGEFDEPLTPEPRIKRLRSDILDFNWVDFLEPGDILIHLAAIADPARSLSEPDFVAEVNVRGTQLVAEACAAKAVPVYFPSTTSVYGKVSDERQDLTFLRPQTPYAQTKVRAEEILKHLSEEKALRYSVIRFGTVFGASPRLRFHPAVNKFCLQAVRGTPVSVWRTALEQKRPYLDICDAVNSICFLIAQDRFEGKTFNAVTVNASVRDILFHIRSKIPTVNYRIQDDPRMNDLSYETECPNLRTAGFEVQGGLSQGIGDVIEILQGRENPVRHGAF